MTNYGAWWQTMVSPYRNQLHLLHNLEISQTNSAYFIRPKCRKPTLLTLSARNTGNHLHLLHNPEISQTNSAYFVRPKCWKPFRLTSSSWNIRNLLGLLYKHEIRETNFAYFIIQKYQKLNPLTSSQPRNRTAKSVQFVRLVYSGKIIPAFSTMSIF